MDVLELDDWIEAEAALTIHDRMDLRTALGWAGPGDPDWRMGKLQEMHWQLKLHLGESSPWHESEDIERTKQEIAEARKAAGQDQVDPAPSEKAKESFEAFFAREVAEYKKNPAP